MTIDEVFKEASGGCQAPGCNCKKGEIVLSPACHPGSGTFVGVDAARGVMRVSCAICNKTVLTINHTMSN